MKSISKIGVTLPENNSIGAQTPITPTITNSVILNVGGVDDHTLEADVRISSNPGNILNIQADGLFVNPAPSIGIDKSVDFPIITSGISGGTNSFATAGLFPACANTPTYTLQWYDPSSFFTIGINNSTGEFTYEFFPFNYLSNNTIVVERNCSGVIDIIRLNYTVDESLIQALNTYYEEGNRTPISYALTIDSVTPQYLQFTSSTGNANMFTNISGNTLLRFDGIAGNTDVVGVIFEIHLSGNVSVPDDEDFTIRLVVNGVPSTDKLMINNWRSKHSFSKHYLITLNPTDTIGFDVLHSGIISPGSISTTFSDVCILLKPIAYAL